MDKPLAVAKGKNVLFGDYEIERDTNVDAMTLAHILNKSAESWSNARVREALEELNQCPHGCCDGNCPWGRKLKVIKEKFQ